MLKLDSIEMSDRLRGYRQRPIERVQPRNHSINPSLKVGMDVSMLKDATQLQNGFKIERTKKPAVINKTKSVLQETNQNLNCTKVLKDSKYEQSKSGSLKVPNNSRLVLDFAKSADAYKQQKQSKSFFKKFNFVNFKVSDLVLYSMAVVVFVVGIVAGIRSLMVNQQISNTVSAQAYNGTEASQNSEVDESKPSDNDVRAYSVAPDMPKIITIPKINVKSRIKQLAMKADGSLDAPKNIYDAGWYTQSSKPGSQGGASLIDGHVSGPTQKGVFYNIKNLKNGDLVIIELGNGSKLDYKVVKVEVKKSEEVNMSKMLVPEIAGTHGLNLITCTGKFDSKTRTYADRALVYTKFERAY